MIYVIQGQEEYFIAQKINEIISDAKGDIIRFNGSDNQFSIDEMLNACMSNSLFSQYATILVSDPYFLTKKIDDKELKQLYEYINNPAYESDLVFYTYTNSFNQKLKIYKDIISNAQVFNFENYNYQNYQNYTRGQIQEAHLDITKEAIDELINMCDKSATLFHQNLEILSLYPDKIDTNVIKQLCCEPEMVDAFKLINAFTDKDISRAISVERKMFSENDSLYSIIGLLAGQLRFIYQVAYYVDNNKNIKEIIELTNSNENRIKMTKKVLEKIGKDQIIELLAKLSDLDCQYKRNDCLSDRQLFELFILNLLKKSSKKGLA